MLILQWILGVMRIGRYLLSCMAFPLVGSSTYIQDTAIFPISCCCLVSIQRPLVGPKEWASVVYLSCCKGTPATQH
jgi:hypothetical protein